MAATQLILERFRFERRLSEEVCFRGAARDGNCTIGLANRLAPVGSGKQSATKSLGVRWKRCQSVRWTLSTPERIGTSFLWDRELRGLWRKGLTLVGLVGRSRPKNPISAKPCEQ